MKYLRRYNESSEYPEVVSIIRDRLLDMEDLGLDLTINETPLSDMDPKSAFLFKMEFVMKYNIGNIELSAYSAEEIDVDKYVENKRREFEYFTDITNEYLEILPQIKSICDDNDFFINMVGDSPKMLEGKYILYLSIRKRGVSEQRNYF